MHPLNTSHPNALKVLFNEDIYRIDSPVAITEEKTPVLIQKEISKTEKKTFNYKGDNNSFFLVLVDDNNAEFINSISLEALLKIMKGKKKGLEDIAILNLNNHPDVGFEELKDFFACSKICLFGISPQSIGLPSIPSNQVESYKNVKLLATFSIDEMLIDVQKKQLFWDVMKNF